MEDATENKEETAENAEETSETPKEPTESIEEKIAKQTETLKKLEESYEKNPSGGLQLELKRETDKLRHLTNTQPGNSRERAEKTADFARETALGRAIVDVPQE